MARRPSTASTACTCSGRAAGTGAGGVLLRRLRVPRSRAGAGEHLAATAVAAGGRVVRADRAELEKLVAPVDERGSGAARRSSTPRSTRKPTPPSRRSPTSPAPPPPRRPARPPPPPPPAAPPLPRRPRRARPRRARRPPPRPPPLPRRVLRPEVRRAGTPPAYPARLRQMRRAGAGRGSGGAGLTRASRSWKGSRCSMPPSTRRRRRWREVRGESTAAEPGAEPAPASDGGGASGGASGVGADGWLDDERVVALARALPIPEVRDAALSPLRRAAHRLAAEEHCGRRWPAETPDPEAAEPAALLAADGPAPGRRGAGQGSRWAGPSRRGPVTASRRRSRGLGRRASARSGCGPA